MASSDVLLAADTLPVSLMGSFFLVCAVFGGGVLLLQLVLGLCGLDGDHDIGHTGLDHAESAYALPHAGNASPADGGGASAGLNLFSVRALTAGLAFFGLSGLAALRAGWPSLLALLAAVVPAVLAMVAVAYLMRSLLRLQSDGSLRMSNAIGSGATVYIPIPGAEAGPGKIMLTLQNRTVECEAVTRGDALPTGTAVTVVDVRDGDVLEVVPTPNPLA
jgi:membrane protein implicated in regulation of membrane protease activity